MRFPVMARKIPDTLLKFPVPILREFVVNLLNWRTDSAGNSAKLTKFAKFPCIFPVKQGIQRRQVRPWLPAPPWLKLLISKEIMIFQRVEIDDSFPQATRSIRVVVVTWDRTGPGIGRTIRRKSLTPILVVRRNPRNRTVAARYSVAVRGLAPNWPHFVRRRT